MRYKGIKYYSLATALLAIFFVSGLVGEAAAATTVGLGTASSFAVLAGTPDITNVPTSVITGDVGLSPATGAGIGLTSTQVMGTIYSVDSFGPGGSVVNSALLTLAKTDLTTAYVDAAGRTPVTILHTELGGTIVTPGIYASNAGTFQITGPLTLNGQGDPDAVFIFQMSSTLTTASASSVVLENGAQACNVFWQVGSSTGELGTNSTFVGTILALTSLNVDSGVNVNGRILARNGAVTLDADTISVPACTSTTTGGLGAGSGGGTLALSGTGLSGSGSTIALAPTLPNTGFSPKHDGGFPWGVVAPIGVAAGLSSLYLLARRKQII